MNGYACRCSLPRTSPAFRSAAADLKSRISQSSRTTSIVHDRNTYLFPSMIRTLVFFSIYKTLHSALFLSMCGLAAFRAASNRLISTECRFCLMIWPSISSARWGSTQYAWSTWCSSSHCSKISVSFSSGINPAHWFLYLYEHSWYVSSSVVLILYVCIGRDWSEAWSISFFIQLLFER